MIMYENEQLLKETQADMSIIPAYTMTFAENSLFVAEATEKVFNELFQQVGVNELAVFESTGMQIVYEGENLKQFKDMVVNAFKKLWSAIKGFFEGILNKFNTMSKEAKKNLFKVDASDVDKLNDDLKFGKTHEFNIDDVVKHQYSAVDFGKKILHEFKALAAKEGLTEDDVKEKKNEIEEKICSEISGISDVKTASDMKKAMMEQLVGKEIEATKSFVKSNLTELDKIVFAGDSIKHIKELYKTNRKYIDTCISYAKGLTDSEIKVSKAAVSTLKQVSNCMTTANGVVCDASRKRYNEYRNILFRVARACGKIKSTNESVEEPVTESLIDKQISAIDKSFAW